jgi:hypothetical protein
MLLRSLNSLGATPRRGRSIWSRNAFARRSNCVSKWKARVQAPVCEVTGRARVRPKIGHPMP